VTDWDQRVAALAPYARTGTDYVRAVADNLRTARRLHADGRTEEAEYWLAEAEESLRRDALAA